MAVTAAEYNNLEAAYDWFNADLFEGRLPAVLITLQRKARCYGYFSHKRFKSRRDGDEHIDELALNPAEFDGRTDMDILSTLAHEMAHVWQFHFGRPSRGGYHNKEWARKMMEIGLMPSNTGEPGGKQTGQQMTHYIMAGGPFERSAAALLARDYCINYQSIEAARIKPQPGGEGPEGQVEKPKSKVKFSCPQCGQNVWGKPSAAVLCGECSDEEHLVRMEPVD
jgi:hypothetical protein